MNNFYFRTKTASLKEQRAKTGLCVILLINFDIRFHIKVCLVCRLYLHILL